MAGVLQFTLGLEVSDFLHKIGLSSSKILGLASVGDGLKKVFEGVSRSIERGADLGHLSKRTGETVANLFMLQKGFSAAGVEADSVGPMLFMMQKSLGGINEEGQSTSDIFSRLGLSLADLRTKGGADQVLDILGALSKLNQEGAAKASSGIFGRMGAANAVQLSRSMEEVRSAMQRAAPMAYVFDRMAEAFEGIERSVRRVKNVFEPMWLGIAQYAIRPIQQVLERMEKIDLSGLGKQIGQVAGLLAESMGDGTIGEVLGLSIRAAFEQAEFYAVKFATALGAALMVAIPAAISTAFELAKMGGRGVQGWLERQNRDLIAQDVNGMEENKAKLGGAWTPAQEGRLAQKRGLLSDVDARNSASEAAAKSANAESIKRVANHLATAIPEAMAAANAAYNTTTPGNPTVASAALVAKMAAFKARMDAVFPVSGEGKKPGEALEFSLGGGHRTEGNVFEKMGFVTGGGGGPAQETARNTAKTVDLLTQLRDSIYRSNDMELRTSTAGMMNDAG